MALCNSGQVVSVMMVHHYNGNVVVSRNGEMNSPHQEGGKWAEN